MIDIFIQQSILCSLVDDESMFFMQDGAPAHYSSNVRDWLDENFRAK